MEEIESNENQVTLPGHSSKNQDLEAITSKETEAVDQFDEDWYEIDDDEEEEEDFEDAIDEIITQNVMECIDEATAPCTSSAIFDSNESRQNGVQKILERQRNELAMELRRLKFDNKPQETIANLENFFNNQIAVPLTSNTTTESTEEQPAQLVPISYRSENVSNEISQLSSRRIVSNIENSFRDSIERSLQQRVSSTRIRMPILPSLNSPRVQTEAAQVTEEVTPTTRRAQGATPTPYLLAPRGNDPAADTYREQIIGEISDLVSRNVVGSALQSNFRTILENNIRDRIRRAGIDGNRSRMNIRDYMRSRVTNAVQRNDFSHLGINNQQDDLDNLDSASSYSGHRNRTVIHQTNTREVRELRNELKEMKSMLKLSFEMQLDMQRSFKQEISALVAGTFSNSASASLIDSSKPSQEGKCIICTESDCDTVFYKCGHMVSCYMCSLNLKNKGHNCPVCRAPITDILRTFKSNLE